MARLPHRFDPRSILIALVALLALTGCPPEMDGFWFGDLDCGPDTVDISMNMQLDKVSSDFYTGDGTVSWTSSSDVYWQIDFDADVFTMGEVTVSSTVVPVEVELSNCEEIDLGDVGCSNDVSGRWFPESDELTGTVRDFMDGPSCDFTLN